MSDGTRVGVKRIGVTVGTGVIIGVTVGVGVGETLEVGVGVGVTDNRISVGVGVTGGSGVRVGVTVGSAPCGGEVGTGSATVSGWTA